MGVKLSRSRLRWSSGWHADLWHPRLRVRWIFTDVKILSMPSSGGVVKESVTSLRHVKDPSSLCELLDY
jgi:hypothetical protein